jgi:cell division protease FtsH
MQMEGFAAMGSTVASHLVTKVSNARQQGESVETGSDRMWLDSDFGHRVEDRLEELLQRVCNLLTENRIWVLALAHALEYYKTVPGDDVLAILNGTEGPTIDGRWYHDPASQTALERYHEVALEAHQESTRVALPLPVPPQPEPEPLAAARRATSNAQE